MWHSSSFCKLDCCCTGTRELVVSWSRLMLRRTILRCESLLLAYSCRSFIFFNWDVIIAWTWKTSHFINDFILFGKTDKGTVFDWLYCIRGWTWTRINVLFHSWIFANNSHLVILLRLGRMIGGGTWTFLPLFLCPQFSANSEYQSIYFQEGDLVRLEPTLGWYARGEGVGGYLCSRPEWLNSYFWVWWTMQVLIYRS